MTARAGGRTILDTGDESRRLRAGEVALLMGPSGAGKSTLLSLIAGLSLPASGEVRVAGQPWNALSERARDQHRAAHVGYMPQREHLLGTLNAFDNVLLPAYFLHGTVAQAAHTRALQLFDLLGISACAGKPVAALSQGEAQRTCLARALLNAPALILADEPTGNLDDSAAARVIDLLTEQAAEAGAALVVATHDARIRLKVPSAQLWTLTPC